MKFGYESSRTSFLCIFSELFIHIRFSCFFLNLHIHYTSLYPVFNVCNDTEYEFCIYFKNLQRADAYFLQPFFIYFILYLPPLTKYVLKSLWVCVCIIGIVLKRQMCVIIWMCIWKKKTKITHSVATALDMGVWITSRQDTEAIALCLSFMITMIWRRRWQRNGDGCEVWCRYDI